MTKERELLRRALDVLSTWSEYKATMLKGEIRAHLADEEGKQEEEPVAYIQKDQLQKAIRSPMLCAVSPEPRQDRVGFFLHPSPQAEQKKPLSFEEIEEKYKSERFVTSWNSFLHGVRWAEKMHKIGGGDE